MCNKREIIEQLLRSVDSAIFELEAGLETFGHIVAGAFHEWGITGAEINIGAAQEASKNFMAKEKAIRQLKLMRSEILHSYDREMHDDVSMLSNTFPSPSPVCFTGSETVVGIHGLMPLVCCVFPERRGGQIHTRVILATRNYHRYKLKEHKQRWTDRSWKNSVAWWVTYGTDTWYLDPTIYEKWSEEDAIVFKSHAKIQGGVPFETISPVKLWMSDFLGPK